MTAQSSSLNSFQVRAMLLHVADKIIAAEAVDLSNADSLDQAQAPLKAVAIILRTMADSAAAAAPTS